MVRGVFPANEVAELAAAFDEIYAQGLAYGTSYRHQNELFRLADAAGLEVGNGIEVDEYARTSDPDIYAAGDVAEFPYLALDARTRVEHWDHAIQHGRAAGANMAGADERYDHLPFFYSDLFDLGYEAVGELDARAETVAELGDVGDSGIVYYVDAERRPRGVLLWNLYGRVDDARELIRAGEPIIPGALAEKAA